MSLESLKARESLRILQEIGVEPVGFLPERDGAINIYFACSFYEKDREPLSPGTRAFYDHLVNHLRDCGYNVYDPAGERVPEKVLDRKAKVEALNEARVSQANVLVCYGGLPAWGAGKEIAMAKRWGVPVIFFLEEGRGVEPIIQEVSDRIIFFNDQVQLDRGLIEALSKFGTKNELDWLNIKRSLGYIIPTIGIILTRELEIILWGLEMKIKSLLYQQKVK